MMIDKFPLLTTNHPLVDRAFRIAIGDLCSNVVLFRDGLLSEPKPCILAGLDYNTPWTRDVAINVWNGVGLLMPQVSCDTLLAVLEQRDGRVLIGGQYWDAIIWATGAWSYYLYTGDQELLSLALQAVKNSLNYFEQTEFDHATGLFRGGSLFNDGVAGYPDMYAQTERRSSGILDWPAANPDKRSHPGYGLPMQALSTNCLYQHAYVVAAKMATELGQPPEPTWNEKAAALSGAINRQFWDRSANRYRYLIDPFGGCDRQESIGWALAILFGIAGAAQREALFRNVHITPAGIPCVWPSYVRYLGKDGQDVGRHSGTVWPFIQAFWAEACARHGKLDAFAHELFTLARCAYRDLQFAEIYHPQTTERYGGLQERGTPEPVLWHSCDRQTWSATGFMRMIFLGLAGLRFDVDGVRFHPAMPEGLNWLRLQGLRYRDAELDLIVEGSGCTLRSSSCNGRLREQAFVPADAQGKQEIIISVG